MVVTVLLEPGAVPSWRCADTDETLGGGVEVEDVLDPGAAGGVGDGVGVGERGAGGVALEPVEQRQDEVRRGWGERAGHDGEHLGRVALVDGAAVGDGDRHYTVVPSPMTTRRFPAVGVNVLPAKVVPAVIAVVEPRSVTSGLVPAGATLNVMSRVLLLLSTSTMLAASSTNAVTVCAPTTAAHVPPGDHPGRGGEGGAGPGGEAGVAVGERDRGGRRAGAVEVEPDADVLADRGAGGHGDGPVVLDRDRERHRVARDR